MSTLILFTDILQCSCGHSPSPTPSTPTSSPRFSTPSTTSPCAAPSTSSLQLHLKGLLIWVQISDAFSSPRYCAVCNPFAYAEHAKPDNVNRRVFKYFIIVIILSVLINIPRFLETKIVTETVRSNDSGSVQDQTFISYDVTDLRRNSDYIRYADLWVQD